MEVFEVLVRRTRTDPLVQAGSILAPDLEMAKLLARETHVRHGEADECFVARRGDVHRVVHSESMSGVLDRSYRRQDGYVGVGARMRRLAALVAERGETVERPRPPSHHAAPARGDAASGDGSREESLHG